MLMMIRPDPDQIRFHPKLLDLAYRAWRQNGFEVMPHPAPLLDLPAGWGDALLMWSQGVQFYADFPKRPAELQE